MVSFTRNNIIVYFYGGKNLVITLDKYFYVMANICYAPLRIYFLLKIGMNYAMVLQNDIPF